MKKLTTKKKILLSVCGAGIAAALLAVAFLLGSFVQRERDEKRRADLLTAQKVQDAAREEELGRNWIELIPGTTRDMLSPDYWKSELSSELLFTSTEIRDYQDKNPLFVAYFDEPTGRTLKLKMYDLPEEIGGHVVRTLMDPGFIDARADGSVATFVNGRQTDKAYWDALRNNCALDLIPETLTPRYCMCVQRDLTMLVPTSDFAAENAEEIYCNDFISAEVMPLTGVVALHESRDKKWSYIINGSYCGWVRTESLAFCADREQWLNAIRPDDFLTVTGCEITLGETALPTRTEGLVLPMGTKIKLLCDFREPVNGRMPYDCYVAQIPCRDPEGAMDWETVLIPYATDVTVGYLPMTSDAVLEQAFKFLGRIYGWGGSFGSNDCSGMVRQVYACFGFELPRNSAAIAESYDLGGRDCKAMTSDKKREILRRMPAGTLLSMEGHLMIYLGTSDNKPYVLSSCGTFIAPGDETGTLVEAYGVFVSDLELLRKDGSTWLESLRYFQWKEY